MQDKGLSDFKFFSGSIQLIDKSVPIDFFALINQRGEVEFNFEPIALTNETSFILKSMSAEQTGLNYFSLFGKSEDGTELRTEHFQINNLGSDSDESGNHIRLKGRCSKVIFMRPLVETALVPTLKMHMKGFQNFHQLVATCELGQIAMHGQSSILDADTITGYIAIQSKTTIQSADLLAWRSEANKLLEHVHRVMSFACSTLLGVTVIEFYSGNSLEVTVFSQGKQSPASMRVFHFMDQQDIFETAVKSFFNPPFEVKNLFFAVEWFAMDSSYSEVRLVNAMTVLENLIASNLSEAETLVRSKKEFEKVRKNIRCILKETVKEWFDNEDERAAALQEINEKMPDLNRKTLLKKLNIIIERWSVPMHGIKESDILAAKKARDLIVHQGYYDHNRGEELWVHVTIVREIVVRIILTVLGFKGRYASHVGGFHDVQFPPVITVN